MTVSAAPPEPESAVVSAASDAQAPLLSEYAQPTAQHLRILWLSWAGWVFDFYDLVLFTFLSKPLSEELDLSRITRSYVLGACLAATAAGGVLFGFLADRFGRKSVLQWTILTYSVGACLSGTASGLWTLIVFRIVTGLGVGGEWATGQTYVCETFPPKVRGRYGAFMQTGAPIGIALASIVGGFVAPVIGWRACFFISVLPALLVVWIRKRLPESDLWLRQRHVARREPEFLALLSKPHRVLFGACLVLAVFDMSAYWFTYSWLPDYLHEERELSLAKSAAWILVTQTGGFLGYFTFGFFADRFGRRPAYSLYSVIMAVGLLMITLFWDAVAGQQWLLLCFMFLVGFGTGMFGGYGPLFAELFPTNIRNTAMGAAFNLARGVQFFTPVIITAVAAGYGMAGGISLAALFALLTGAWIWVFPETRGTRLPSAPGPE